MKNTIALVSVHKFVTWDCAEPCDLLGKQTAAEWLEDRYYKGNIGLDELMRHNRYKLLGNSYNFNMPKFIYKQFGQWHEAYAPNKTLLRAVVYGRIDQIVSV